MSTSIEARKATDFELVQRVAQRDEEAFAQLYNAHNEFLRCVCVDFVRNQDIVDDVIQEVWQVIWRRANAFRGDSQFRTWAYRVVINQSIIFFRREKTRSEGRRSDDAIPVVVVPGSENYHNMSIVSKIRLKKALEQLAPGYRLVFCLKAGMDYEHEEIGKLLGISTGTSKSQYLKAREKLRKLLEEKKDFTSLN